MSVSPQSSVELISAGGSATGRMQSLRVAGVMVLLVLGLLLFWQTTASLIEQWEDTGGRRTYTHGYFIVAITLWLLWRRRSGLAQVRVAPSLAAFVALVATSIAWLVAFRAGLQIVHQVLLPAIIFLAVATSYGTAAARRTAFPFGFFYLAVPIWDALIPPLQLASVEATRFLLRVVGIPAYFSGTTFTLPAGSLMIADGCSGLHFFVVALAISLLYGEVNRDSMRTRVQLVAFAILLAMATNWLRIFIIAVAGHLTDMQHPLVSKEHYTFGWMMFVGTMIVFFLVVRRWPVHAGESLPNVDVAEGQGNRAIPWRGVALGLAGLLVAPVSLFLDSNRATLDGGATVLPASVSGWSINNSVGEDWQPVFAGADALQRRAFSDSSQTVETFAALYASQRQHKELLGYDNSVAGANQTIKQAGPSNAAAWMEMEAIDGRGDKYLLWYAYRIDEQWYRPGLKLQLAYGLRSLISAPLAAAVAFRTACAGDDCSEARGVLSKFAADAWPGSTAR